MLCRSKPQRPGLSCAIMRLCYTPFVRKRRRVGQWSTSLAVTPFQVSTSWQVSIHTSEHSEYTLTSVAHATIFTTTTFGHMCNLLMLISDYCGIKLPCEIILPGKHNVHPTIKGSGYSRSRILHLD